jgi:hypothetical protein
VRIRVPGADKRNYYVEYRNPNAGPYAGYKNQREDPLIRSVLVYVENETDIREGIAAMGEPLRVGASYHLPGGVGVRLVESSCSDGTALAKDREDAYRVQCGPVLPAAMR